jgi:hypothetical protein
MIFGKFVQAIRGGIMSDQEEVTKVISSYNSITYYDVEPVYVNAHCVWLIKLTIKDSDYLMDVLVHGHIKQSIEDIIGYNIQWNIKHI